MFSTFVGVHRQVGVTQPGVKDPAHPLARSARSLEVRIPRYPGSKVTDRDLVLRVATCCAEVNMPNQKSLSKNHSSSPSGLTKSQVFRRQGSPQFFGRHGTDLDHPTTLPGSVPRSVETATFWPQIVISAVELTKGEPCTQST